MAAAIDQVADVAVAEEGEDGGVAADERGEDLTLEAQTGGGAAAEVRRGLGGVVVVPGVLKLEAAADGDASGEVADGRAAATGRVAVADAAVVELAVAELARARLRIVGRVAAAVVEAPAEGEDRDQQQRPRAIGGSFFK